MEQLSCRTDAQVGGQSSIAVIVLWALVHLAGAGTGLVDLGSELGGYDDPKPSAETGKPCVSNERTCTADSRDVHDVTSMIGIGGA
jgi:hypothetical protein